MIRDSVASNKIFKIGKERVYREEERGRKSYSEKERRAHKKDTRAREDPYSENESLRSNRDEYYFNYLLVETN